MEATIRQTASRLITSVAKERPKAGTARSGSSRPHNPKRRILIAALILVVLLYLVKILSVLEVDTKVYTPELFERMRRGELDISLKDLERMDAKLLTSEEPLYSIMLGRVEMSNAQRKKILQEAVDKQLAPYIAANRTYTTMEVDRLKKKNNFAMRVIKHGDNLTIVQTEQEKENWSYWYRMDQTYIALKAMNKLGMLPHRFDLVVNLNDEPNMSQRDFGIGLPPLFSYCSTSRNLDLIWVGWQYWRCLSPRHWEDFMAEPGCEKPWNVTESALAHQWNSRVAQALWRGSPTGRQHTESNWREKPRPILALLSKNHSDVLNCTLSTCQESQCTEEAVKAMEEEIGFSELLLRPQDYLRHKYLVDVDGNSYSARFPMLLSTGALIFKQESHYTEFLDLFFQPERHYIRVNKNFDNLVDEVGKAMKNDRRAELVAARSLSMIHYIIEKDVVFEYLQTLIEAYAKLIKWDDEDS